MSPRSTTAPIAMSTTVASPEAARRIARALVERPLAAGIEGDARG